MTSISSYSTRSRAPPHPLATNPDWVHARFERAVDIIQSLPKSGPIQTSYEQKLTLYSVYKQGVYDETVETRAQADGIETRAATEGDVKSSRPGMLDILGRAKWDAWNKRMGMSQLEAERLYVEALLQILRSFSDRTQAVELLRELEHFEMDIPGGAGAGAKARRRASTSATDTGSDSSSTASYDDRRPAVGPSASASRSMPPPLVPPSQSARQTPSRQPSRLAPPSMTGSHYSRLTPEQVAPPLPGYGPPRTRADPVRRRQVPDDAYSTGSSYDSASEEEAYARRASEYHPAPASLSARPPPPPRHVASSIRSNAGSTPVPRSAVPSIAAGPSLAAGTPSLPLTASNLRAVSVPPPSLPPPSPAPVQAPLSVAQPPPGLDAALERIQVSLTALHERLSLLEEHAGPSPLPALPSTGSGPLGLLKETVNRLLVMVALRRNVSLPPSSSSPALALRTRSPSQPSFFALVFRLLGAVASSARRAAGDLAVVFAVAVLIGRLRGVDLLGLVVRRYLGTGSAGERRSVGGP
ncbi:Acyl-CoA-binding 3 [Rhodotorula toruloides]|nr:Acyl-CoA-binding 3 [Rhodotorula toruloides]